MGQALYRAYRPKRLSEIVGQEHITTTLTNALKNGRISHAYLLTGPRGVGKTSIARILAHEINGIPYDDEAHLDIIEIDAASNRRIDEIRDLRDRVSTAPASAKYKVYIIDEVHMLTKEAFNALLKTLEEPPAHVVFILATTESHKLPETIISRTQRYTFRPVAAEQVIAHLEQIAKAEKIQIDAPALALIAQHGEGSFRDSISLLDQASNMTDNISKSDIEQMLGLAPDELITSLEAALEQADSATIVSNLMSIYNQGYEAATVAAQLGERLRNVILEGNKDARLSTAQSLALLRQLLDVPAARQPKQLLELLLLQASFIDDTPTKAPATKKVVAHAPPPATVTLSAPVTLVTSPVIKTPAKAKVSEPEAATEITEESLPDFGTAPAPQSEPDIPVIVNDIDVADLWQQALNDIKKQYNTLYGIARMATPVLEGNTLTLHLKFAFHQKRLNEAKNRQIFSDVITRLNGQPLEIFFVLTEASPSVAKPSVDAISNIFGGAELLES